jgi:Tfp pilus assembly protein PilF
MSIIGDIVHEMYEKDVPHAMKTVCKALKEDPGYYESWKANIAMAFKDEWESEWYQQSEQDKEDIHKLANIAAANFLNLLIK